MDSDTESNSVSTSSDELTNSSDVPDAFETFGKEDVVRSSVDVTIDQYAKDVDDFSSQYGSDYSISYTALNMTGRPSKYPNYGDFPETFAMRTYGPWWDIAPSKCDEFKPQNSPKIPSQDFIILKFEQYVIPEKLLIFETYNPGALVRIWAYTMFKQWLLLWEGAPQRHEHKSRKFTQVFRKALQPIRTIRLEFNHSHLDYFTEIDGIILIGKTVSNIDPSEYLTNWPLKGRMWRKLDSTNLHLSIKESHEAYLKDFLVNDLEKFISSSELLNEEKDIKDKSDLNLKDLPYEILLKIFDYLDLISLFRVGQVCKLTYEIASHPLLYSEINLKPYWHMITPDLLESLSKRSRLLKKLDLSWCGLYNSINQKDFNQFILQNGNGLTHLRLNSSSFLTANCLNTVGCICDNLKELSIRNFNTETYGDIRSLAKLKNLERLDLSRTFMDTKLLLKMLENNPNLKHLNLAFCGNAVSMDEIAIQIAKFNRKIVSLDMWKSQSLSSIGLQALALCHHLEEVDFGWCLREEPSPGESLKCLVKGCPNLKKLFLAAIRSITDRDLENIANYCPNLEQLDLMGVLGISTEKCHKILVKCKKLKLLDLNFVDHLDEEQINSWRALFNVDIKRTFVPCDYSN